MKKTVAVFGTFDTKGHEFSLLFDYLRKEGLSVVSIDMSTKGEGELEADFSVEAVLTNADISREMFFAMERDDRMIVMTDGARRIINDLIKENRIHGVISLGGGQGAFMAGKVMSGLPVGFPKMIVSTTVNVPTSMSHYSDINDTVLMNSLVDISGMNPILEMVLKNAAGAIAGMAKAANTEEQEDNAVFTVAISMWGVTTPCVTRINEIFDNHGYRTYIFHANGQGGRTMENLAESRLFDGIADISMSEFTTPLAGGEGDPITSRLIKAGEAGIPRVVSFGGADMVLFAAPFNIPDKFKNRPYYMHNKNLMFIRSTPEENILFAEAAAERLNASKGPVKVLLPLKGLSAVDIEGNVMYDPEADQALFTCLKEKLDKRIEVRELDFHINDDGFADAVAETLIGMLEK